MKKNILVLLILSLNVLDNGLFCQHPVAKVLTEGWSFHLGSIDISPEKINTRNWEKVVVPHDWAINKPFIPGGDGATAKLPWKGEGWYHLNLGKLDKSKKQYLIFDGVMSFPKVYINGRLAGEWDYGYNSFYLDISNFILSDDNALLVYADTRNHGSRWYPGAGIFRKVRLVELNPVHVNIWGTYITTPVIKSHYVDVRIRTEIKNGLQEKNNVKVVHCIVNDKGTKIKTTEIIDTLKNGHDLILEANITLTDPIRWDIDNPHIYKVITEVYLDEKVDEYHSSFGVRDMRFDPDHGFYLNNRRVQLKGVNLHHDHGPLGAAFNRRAMERQLQIMKDMGANAIRNSHNTAAPELLELCDEMGLLVFNEIFDKYDDKADITPDTDFEEFAHRNIKNFVTRDRNHPSIFLWSVGNEIGDVQWNINRGFERLHTMINYLRKYDYSRPVTLVNDNWQSADLRHFDYYDVHSWNYGRRYRLARQLEPNKSVIISESASTLSTRGFYELPLPEKKTDFTKSLQVSSYDLNAPWWAEIADDDFMWQQEEEYIAGEFVWTGFDYLGEPTPYDNIMIKDVGLPASDASRSSYFGIVDLVGIPKDRYYLYKSYWSKENTVHILPHWNWEGTDIDSLPVFVYTNGTCAELFLNGESLGLRCKQPKSKNAIERFRLMWDKVAYKPGELKAVAYTDHQKIGEEHIKTAGKAIGLRLTPDRLHLKSHKDDLSYILVEGIDAAGIVHPLAMHRLNIEVSGNGKLAGAGNGNPQSFELMQDNSVDLFF